jgi:hypothetical protein
MSCSFKEKPNYERPVLDLIKSKIDAVCYVMATRKSRTPYSSKRLNNSELAILSASI